MSSARSFLSLLVAGILVGCVETPAPIPPVTSGLDPISERSARDSVVAMLTAADRRALDGAFGRLAEFSYERTVEVRQVNEAEVQVAERVWEDRFEGRNPLRRRTETWADSSGEFADGFFGGFSRRAVPEESNTELAPFILPTDPPYLTGRGREAYRFRTLSDSMAHGIRLQRVLIEVNPAEPGTHQLRRIQIAIEPTSRLIVGAGVVFDHFSLLYRERSHFDFRMQPVGAVWLPERLEMDSRIGSTVFDERHFQVRMAWSGFRPN